MQRALVIPALLAFLPTASLQAHELPGAEHPHLSPGEPLQAFWAVAHALSSGPLPLVVLAGMALLLVNRIARNSRHRGER